MRYRDKVTIVTGGSKGIGAGCVRVFVEEGGGKVVFCSRNESEGKAFESEVNKKGPGSALFVRADVAKVDDVKRVIDLTASKFGRID
jgi:NAD(P)-dependent dehydrogenase (short-subunit alcohol dehydrogenase family)